MGVNIENFCVEMNGFLRIRRDLTLATETQIRRLLEVGMTSKQFAFPLGGIMTIKEGIYTYSHNHDYRVRFIMHAKSKGLQSSSLHTGTVFSSAD